MIRVLNFACFAFTAFVCLALYHVSEQTRIARVQLSQTERNIRDQHDAIKVLQADWERVSAPEKIQALASTRLGLTDTATVALASLELLPRRGDAAAAESAGLRSASIETTAPQSDPRLHLVAAHSGD
jgi:hypothetical protein